MNKMSEILLSLYSLFLIYIGYEYIAWNDFTVYSLAKLLILVFIFMSQFIVHKGIYRRFIKEKIDSAYHISLRTITGIYGVLMAIYLMFIPISFGIDNITIIFIVTLIYLTICFSIIHAGEVAERQKNL